MSQLIALSGWLTGVLHCQVTETQIVKFSDTGKTKGCFILLETRDDLIGALDFEGEVGASACMRHLPLHFASAVVAPVGSRCWFRSHHPT